MNYFASLWESIKINIWWATQLIFFVDIRLQEANRQEDQVTRDN
ncbi:GSCOCG00000466001-RA-CDS [Cotesia congregata]|nr:GSCOCG00000466001-RA-CDS [Cotesia congregata]